MADKKLVVVRSPFFLGSRLVGVGEIYADDDPVVVGRPRAFGPVEVKASQPEQPRRTHTRRAPSRSTSKRQGKKKS